MAKIHIENGIISSSADYGLYHGTSEIAKVEAGGLRVQGDVTAENLIISSSVTYMTQSFSSGSTIFGDSSDDIHQMTGSYRLSKDTTGSGGERTANHEMIIIKNDNSVLPYVGFGASINFQGRTYNNSTIRNLSTIKHQINDLSSVDGTTGTHLGSSLDFITTDLGNSTTVSSKMKILGSGNVHIANKLGIGTTNPSFLLDVNGTARFSNAVTFSQNIFIASGYNLYLDGGSNTYIKENSADTMTFTTAGVERVRIASDGKVGIGDTSPTEGKLVVSGDGAASNPTLHLEATTSTTFNHFANMRNSNLTAGENGIIVFGQELATKNAAWIGFKYNSDGGDDNQLSLGFWSANNLVNLLPNGNLGIGTESPSTMLHLKSSTSTKPKITIEDTNADDNMGALQFIKDSASPGTGDKLMQIWAYGDNDAAEQILYSEIATLPTSVADGSEEGSMRFRVMSGGSFVETMRVRADKVGIGNTSPGKELHIGDGTGTPDLKLSGTNTGTNPAATGHGASNIILHNASATDGNFSFIDGNNSNDAVDSRIVFIHDSHSSRHGEIGFLVHNGSALTERVRLDKDGKFGIGTTSPSAALHVKGGAYNENLILQGSSGQSGITMMGSDGVIDGYVYANAGYIGFLDDDTHWAIQHQTDTQTSFHINNTEYMRLTTTGLGINTSTPDNTLTINGGVSISGSAPMIKFKDTDDSSFSRLYHSAGRLIFDADHSDGTQQAGSYISFRVDDSEKMRISGSGNVGIGKTDPVGKLHVLGSSYNHLELESAAGNVGIVFDVETSNTNYYDWRIDAQGLVANGLCIGVSTGLGNQTFDSSGTVMTLKSDGKVGIGVTDPDTTLEVDGIIAATGANRKIYVGESALSAGTFGFMGWNDASNYLYLGHSYNGAFNADIVIEHGGNVGIGQTNPSNKLDVVGVVEINASGQHIKLDTLGAGQNNWITWLDNGSNKWEVNKGTDQSFNIYSYQSAANLLSFPAAGTSAQFSVPITVNGNVSGSAASTGSFGMVTAGVSTAQAGGKFHVQGVGAGQALGIIEDTSGNANFLIKATAANKNSLLLFGDAASDEIGRIDYDHNDNSLDFVVNNSTALTIDSSGNIIIAGQTNNIIHNNTSDASDNKSIRLDGGGGGGSSTRGAYVAVHGNEHGSDPGELVLQSGNVTGAAITFRGSGGTDMGAFTKDGDFGIGTTSPVSITNHKVVELKNTAANGRATLALTANNAEYSNLYMGDSDDVDVGGIQYYHGTNVMDFYVGGSSRLHINNSGNVGIGVTPEANWLSTRTALQIGGSGAIFGATAAGANGTLNIGQNVYFHSGGSYRRIDADEVSMYTQRDGTHIFKVAGSSTDNSTISFTDALTIANDGLATFSDNIASSRDNFTISANSGLLQLRTLEAGQNMLFDTGGDFLFRDVDDSNATRLTIASGTGNATFSGDVVISDGEGLSTTSFTSGFAGAGYRIDQGISTTGKTSAEFDNLTVRGTMSIYELLIQQVRATNGNLFISSTGKIDSVSEAGGTFTLGVDTGEGSGHGFAAGDVIRMQRFNNSGAGANVTVSDLTVQTVTSTGSFTATLSGTTTPPSGGFEYVRLGNTTSSSRQGGVYLTADDSNAPFIDVFDEITAHSDFNTTGKIKTRMGKLSGITSPRFGTLSGFGFWASGSVYLEGNVNATAGNIGGWGISGNAITSSAGIISIDANAKRITVNDGTNDRVYLGEIDGGSQYGIKIFDAVGGNHGTNPQDSDILVELGSSENKIVGWELTPGRFQFDHPTGSIALDAGSQQVSIFTGSINTAKPKVVMGKLPRVGGDSDDDRYGFAVFSGSEDASILHDDRYSVLITRDRARLAGWDLEPGSLLSDNSFGSVRLSSITQALTIWTGSVNEAQPKLVLGKLPLNDGTVDSPYGFAVFSGTGTVSGSEASASVLITANKARLAGWELVPGRLKSGTVADINGNQGSIALGTGATSADGTPTDGLFFVSASAKPVFYVGSTFSYVDDVLKAGGWEIGNNVISSSNGKVKLDATNVSIQASNNNYSINLGQTKSANGSFTGQYGISARRAGSPDAVLFRIDSSVQEISGWTIGTYAISKNDISINSNSGYIKAGTVAAATDVDRTTKGIWLDDDGTFLMKAGGSANLNYIQSSGGNLIVSMSNFSVQANGDVSMSGEINAAGGTIGGMDIGATSVTVGSTLVLNSTGHITGSAILFKGGKIGGMDVGTTSVSVGSDLVLNSDGSFIATNATLTGTVTANAGAIGGFGITANNITGSGVELRSGANAQLVLHQDGGNTDGMVIARSSVPSSGNSTGYNIFSNSTFAAITSSNAFADLNIEFNMGTDASSTGGNLGFAGTTAADYEEDQGKLSECFVAGTKVTMADGTYKNIEDIEIGEEVLSADVHTLELTTKKVRGLFNQLHTKEEVDRGNHTVKIELSNGVILHTTMGNPFWSKDKGFVAADAVFSNREHSWVRASNFGKPIEQMEIGDILYDDELNEVEVLGFEYILEPDIMTYDISIPDTHVFFADTTLTHNTPAFGGVAAAGKFRAFISGSGETLGTRDKLVGLMGKVDSDASAGFKGQAIAIYGRTGNLTLNGSVLAGGSEGYAGWFDGKLVVTGNVGPATTWRNSNTTFSTATDPAIVLGYYAFNSGREPVPDTDTGIYYPFYNTIGIGASGTDSMRFDTTNNTSYRHLIPSADSTYTIGGSSNYWSHGYIDAITTTGNISVGGDVLPSTSAAKDLGSTSLRWQNIYTTDLQLSNMDRKEGNVVDGTKGDWTLQEGDENLYVINNISGKKYKIALIPMDDKDE